MIDIHKCVCDICGIDEPQRHFKIKEQKLVYSSGSNSWLRQWKEVDVCDQCFENLVKLRYEKSLEDRIYNELLSDWDVKFDNWDTQSAYLQGLDDCLKIMLPSKIETLSRELREKIEKQEK